MVNQIVLIVFASAPVLFAVRVFLFSGTQRRIAFEEKFPPISDEEFIARCGPGTNPEVALKVWQIVADQMGIEYARIHPSTSFVDDLGAD